MYNLFVYFLVSSTIVLWSNIIYAGHKDTQWIISRRSADRMRNVERLSGKRHSETKWRFKIDKHTAKLEIAAEGSSWAEVSIISLHEHCSSLREGMSAWNNQVQVCKGHQHCIIIIKNARHTKWSIISESKILLSLHTFQLQGTTELYRRMIVWGRSAVGEGVMTAEEPNGSTGWSTRRISASNIAWVWGRKVGLPRVSLSSASYLSC